MTECLRLVGRMQDLLFTGGLRDLMIQNDLDKYVARFVRMDETDRLLALGLAAGTVARLEREAAR